MGGFLSGVGKLLAQIGDGGSDAPIHSPAHGIKSANDRVKEIEEELKRSRLAAGAQMEEIKNQQKELLLQAQKANTEELEKIRNDMAAKAAADEAKIRQAQALYNEQLAKQQRIVEELKKAEAERLRAEKELRDYPCPGFLEPYKEKFINICIVGASGSGKSTFLNLCRGLKPKDHRCAHVGHGKEGTMEPTRYNLTNLGQGVNIWDMPGDGTEKHPAKTYFKNTGVKWFDLVLIFTVARFREMDRDLSIEMEAHHVPFIYVRNKADSSMSVMVEDEGMSEEEAKRTLKENVIADSKLPAGTDVFVVSSRWSKQTEYDMPRLMKHMIVKVTEVRLATAQ